MSNSKMWCYLGSPFVEGTCCARRCIKTSHLPSYLIFVDGNCNQNCPVRKAAPFIHWSLISAFSVSHALSSMGAAPLVPPCVAGCEVSIAHLLGGGRELRGTLARSGHQDPPGLL